MWDKWNQIYRVKNKIIFKNGTVWICWHLILGLFIRCKKYKLYQICKANIYYVKKNYKIIWNFLKIFTEMHCVRRNKCTVKDEKGVFFVAQKLSNIVLLSATFVVWIGQKKVHIL